MVRVTTPFVTEEGDWRNRKEQESKLIKRAGGRFQTISRSHDLKKWCSRGRTDPSLAGKVQKKSPRASRLKKSDLSGSVKKQRKSGESKTASGEGRDV